ncbi:OsmC family protein [Saccharothrix coeruleofusca]|uniref:Osmotically inducible protein C n=1 Tax=Saccharothrix coeruleofusca TaxID=33919 RepID=A0A918ANP4_9PSEU|nr:OsmC family protein [Saccharothrix coeruleofusca]MBP2336216.1 organic hydroperoxide reductase OsmC/OhrA [Saccharothrix coeruleofusca]GGP54563.1 osmotically inducible protein C [Saccharothrix coeruleofusca]
MTSSATQLYTTTAVSTRASVRVDDAEPAELAVAAPRELAGPGGGWNPEQLYAAALATCLHQSLAVIASSAGDDLTGCQVTAGVSLRHEGTQTYDLDARLKVELPGVPEERRQDLVDLAVSHAPMIGGWHVAVA